MAVEINGKVYRNLPEQVKKNQEDIEALQERVEDIEENPLLDLNLENGSGENSLQQKGNTASGKDSFAHGLSNTASNIQAHAEGIGTQAVGNFTHSEGQYTVAHADISHTEGVGNVVGDLTQTAVRDRGQAGHAEGLGNIVLGQYAHAEGANNVAKGDYSHANGIGGNDWANPGNSEIATIIKIFDELNYIQANSSANTFYSGGGRTLILDGFNSGTQSYANFTSRVKTGDILRVIHSPSGNVEEYEVFDIVGSNIRVSDANASLKWQANDTSIKIELKIAVENIASGTAYGTASFVAGFHNTAINDYQTVVGKFNNNNKSNTLFEVGNGTDNTHRSNAFEVYQDGTIGIPNFNSNEERIGTKRIKCVNGVLRVID